MTHNDFSITPREIWVHKNYTQIYFVEDENGNEFVTDINETDEFWFPTFAFCCKFEIWKKDFSLGFEAYKIIARSATHKGE